MKTVVALFDSLAAAETARAALIRNGIVADDISAAATDPLAGFPRLGVPAHEAEVYAEGIHRGHILLSLSVADPDAPRIADILSQYGAVDLEQRAGQWQSAGWQRKHPISANPAAPANPAALAADAATDPEAAAKARDIQALETGNINSSEPYPANRGIDLGAVTNAGASIGSVGTGLNEGIGDTGRRRTARIY